MFECPEFGPASVQYHMVWRSQNILSSVLLSSLEISDPNVFAPHNEGQRYPGAPTPHTPHPTPYTSHPTLYPPYPTPYTLHPSSCTLHPTPHAPCPTPYTLHPTPYIPHPTPFTLHPTPYTLHNTLYPPGTPYTLSPAPGSIGLLPSIPIRPHEVLHANRKNVDCTQLCSNFCMFGRIDGQLERFACCDMTILPTKK